MTNTVMIVEEGTWEIPNTKPEEFEIFVSMLTKTLMRKQLGSGINIVAGYTLDGTTNSMKKLQYFKE